MKKYLLGFLVGAILFAPSLAIAGIVYTPNYINDIYQTDENVKVGVFDDSGNKCYVAYRELNNEYDEQPAISCLKDSE